MQQPPDQWLPDPRDQLDRLQRLHRADQSRHHPQHPRLRARRHRPRFWRPRIHAAITRTTQVRRKDRHLPLEPPHRTVNIRHPQRHARIIRCVARGKIIAPIDHHVPPASQLHRVRRRETRGHRLHPHMRIHLAQRRLGRFHFGPANIARSMQNLPVQIRQLHFVRIDDAQSPHPRRRQIKRRRRSQTAGPNQEHARRPQLLLPGQTELRQRHLPRIPLQFLRRKHATPCSGVL